MLAYSFWSAYRRRGECQMKPRRSVRTMLWLSALVWLLAAANTLTAAEPPFVTLDSGAEPVRSAFNADIGKTRVVMLLGPT
jgi:hypothetical protein